MCARFAVESRNARIPFKVIRAGRPLTVFVRPLFYESFESMSLSTNKTARRW
jgi:hypothetical protein